MNKKIYFLLLSMLILIVSCSSKLSEYTTDSFDNKELDLVDGSDDDILRFFDITYLNTWASNKENISQLNQLVNDENYVANSESNTYILVFNTFQEVPTDNINPNNTLYSKFYSAKDDPDNCFINTKFTYLDNKNGCNSFSLSGLTRCGKKGGISSSNYILSFNLISFLYKGENNNNNLSFEHYQYSNYDTQSHKSYMEVLKYCQRFITNIYFNDILVGRIGYYTHNKKSMSEVIERLIIEHSKFISYEDFINLLPSNPSPENKN